MPEDLNYEFIKGLIRLAVLYDAFGYGDPSCASEDVFGQMVGETKEQLKKSLLRLINCSEDWELMLASSPAEIVADGTALVPTDINHINTPGLNEEGY